MLTAQPQSLLSSTYTILRGNSPIATLTFNFFSEQGAITHNHITYTVKKHGLGSGKWTLESPTKIHATAVKPSMFRRRFEIQTPTATFTLQPKSLGRSFELLAGPRHLGTITPAHFFTRRADIDCPSLPELEQLFAFWLTALLWRRANNSAAASANP